MLEVVYSVQAKGNGVDCKMPGEWEALWAPNKPPLLSGHVKFN